MKNYRSKLANFDGTTLIVITKYTDKFCLPEKLHQQLLQTLPAKILITDSKGAPRGSVEIDTFHQNLKSAVRRGDSGFAKDHPYYVMPYKQAVEYGDKMGRSGPVKLFSKEEIARIQSERAVA
jgi:hypothetical protein